MADPKGFLKHGREVAERRPVEERVHDWNEVYPGGAGPGAAADHHRPRPARCMDCGIPFCHQGCPLGNLIPEWNDLVWRDDWDDAIERLHATNNFPEFTGRLCPAPCETACVLGHQPGPGHDQERRGRDHRPGLGVRATSGPQPPEWLSGRTVAVVGSGPAGLAAAQQLTRAGHTVAVYERADRIGGLLRYGIPEFKMEKTAPRPPARADAARGHRLPGRRRRRRRRHRRQRCVERYDAVVLADRRDRRRATCRCPGRELDGIHQAMEFLPQSNRVSLGEEVARPDHRRGQARRDHRRRRHRGRLPRHRDPAGRGLGHPAGDPAQPPDGAARRTSRGRPTR